MQIEVETLLAREALGETLKVGNAILRYRIGWADDQIINGPDRFLVAVVYGRTFEFRGAIAGRQLYHIDSLHIDGLRCPLSPNRPTR